MSQASLQKRVHIIRKEGCTSERHKHSETLTIVLK